MVKDSVPRCARLYRAPIWWYPSGGGGTREAGRTVTESLVALYRVCAHRFGEGGEQLDRRRARGGVLNARRGRESKAARIGRLLREKLVSGHGLFSSYEDQQGAANGQDSWDFFRDAQGFGRVDAGSRSGFISSRSPPPWTSVFQFSLFLYDV